ncbi:MAG: radical SAM protein [Bacteriovorax sp.]|nr:radical SAM protein [Bacteriovorax sp.]
MSPAIAVPSHYNYVAAFLTLACNLKCSYCINHLSGPAQKKGFLKGEEWIQALNRLELPTDLPITLQGGEPTVHPHFYQIVKGLREDIAIDLLTNLQFNPIEFSKIISPARLKRDSQYASIRATYHPETMAWGSLLEKVIWMKEKGYAITIYGILHPRDQVEILRAQASAQALGVEFKTKEFLGEYEGQIYGSYRFQGAVFNKDISKCLCKTSELLIGVDGNTYRCHHDLYNKFNHQGNLLDKSFAINDSFKPCERFGNCNPCDVKIKNNRHQQWDHTSVEIKQIENYSGI